MSEQEQADSGVTDSPKKGPTLSTSTSSFEALDTHDPHLSKLATKMFQKTSDYISHELNSSLEDYKLLQSMNKATAAKYSDMKQIAENLTTSSRDLDNKITDLQPFLELIDSINESVNKLETAAYKLDASTQELESKLNKLIKRK